MATSEVRLWPVPPNPHVVPCRACGARMAFVPGKSPGKQIPASLDSPIAKKDAAGNVLEAPSHYSDCPAASTFSRKGKS